MGIKVIGENEVIVISGLESAVREVSNGIWAVSSIMLLGIILWYILNERSRNRDWWRSPGIQLAGALGILITGHFIRSSLQWIQLIQLNAKIGVFELSSWWGGWRTFLLSTIFVLLGKILVIFATSPPKWKWYLVAIVLVVSISIPFTILVVL